MKGYYTSIGYKGYIPGEGYILFATQEEYIEIYKEERKDNEEIYS